MMLRKRAAGVWLLAVLFSALPLCATQRSVGFVQEIRGSAWIGEPGQVENVRLDEAADIGRRVYAGERLKCDRGGRIILRVGSQRIRLEASVGWYTVPSIVPDPKDPHQSLLDAYARIGGRDRVVSSIVLKGPRLYSPANDGVAVPDSVVFRWTGVAVRCRVSLAIRTTNGAILWQASEVKGAAGWFKAADASVALARYRNASGGDAPLEAAFRDSCGGASEVRFRLLSVAEERSLKETLGFWDSEKDPLTTALGRAAVFEDAGLTAEAAEEYETGLALAPKSRHLLRRTLEAQQRCGNFRRAADLAKRLPPGSLLPR